MAKDNKQSTGTFRDGIKARLKIVSVLLFLFGAALVARLASLQIAQPARASIAPQRKDLQGF